jgi:signal transduction histidine kinase
MRTIELIGQIKARWIERVAERLARGEGVRESFKQELDLFFEALKKAVAANSPTWLAPVLDGWTDALTSSELEQKQSSLSPLLSQSFLLMTDIARESFSTEQTLEIIITILPYFTYTFEYVTAREAEFRITHVARELEKARSTLEKLDKSKSDFIAVAAHELKTPLTLIEGYSAMLHDLLQAEKQQSQSAILLRGIDNGARRLRTIIDDMIDVSMIDNNLLSLNYQPIWLNRLLAMIRNDVHETVTSRRQILEICRFPGSEDMTFGDAERLYQALKNLVSNAVKYTPDGGYIRIDGRKLPGFIEVTITDTGIGIDPQDHALIFENFGRIGNVSLHSSGKTKFKGGGPGLGLPIAKGIIEAHGGAIWVESEGYDEVKCPGATFHVLLPLLTTPPDDKIAKLFKPLTDQS